MGSRQARQTRTAPGRGKRRRGPSPRLPPCLCPPPWLPCPCVWWGATKAHPPAALPQTVTRKARGEKTRRKTMTTTGMRMRGRGIEGSSSSCHPGPSWPERGLGAPGSLRSTFPRCCRPSCASPRHRPHLPQSSPSPCQTLPNRAPPVPKKSLRPGSAPAARPALVAPAAAAAVVAPSHRAAPQIADPAPCHCLCARWSPREPSQELSDEGVTNPRGGKMLQRVPPCFLAEVTRTGPCPPSLTLQMPQQLWAIQDRSLSLEALTFTARAQSVSSAPLWKKGIH